MRSNCETLRSTSSLFNAHVCGSELQLGCQNNEADVVQVAFTEAMMSLKRRHRVAINSETIKATECLFSRDACTKSQHRDLPLKPTRLEQTNSAGHSLDIDCIAIASTQSCRADKFTELHVVSSRSLSNIFDNC